MAGARAAASLSLTIGVAFSTLLIVGGILAGPAILDCSKDTGSLGACLRAKVGDSGLLPDLPLPEAPPVLPGPVLPQPVPTGWIEANATEYWPVASTAAELAADPMTLEAAGQGVTLPATSLAELTEAPAAMNADGAEAPDQALPPRIVLAEPGGRVAADAAVPVAPEATAVRMLSLPHDLTAGAATATPLVVSVAADPSGAAAPLATGSIGAATITGSAALDVVMDALPPRVEPPPLPEPPVVKSPEKQAPKPERPKRRITYDPRFPSIIVLPPPATGEDSAFVTLELN